MEKDTDRISNGSYLFRLNEELSGQAELDPYFFASGSTAEQETVTESTTGAELNLSQGGQDDPDQ